MRSPTPKMLHEVCGTTLLECVIEAVQKAGISKIIVVVGDKKETVKDCVGGMSVKIVEQQKQLGTAHAVQSAQHLLSGATGIVMVLNGDTPLVKPQTLKKLVDINAKTNSDVTLLTACLDKPQGYGRISRDVRGCIKGIVEESEANINELKIKEINVGIYVFKTTSLFEGLDEIAPHNKKGEFYLTDIISIFYSKGKKIEGLASENPIEVLGINTQEELAVANQLKRDEIMRSFMDKGVTIVNPPNTFIENHVEIGEGTKVYPFTYICKNVDIGQQCSIGPFVYLKAGTKIADCTEVKNMVENTGFFSKIEG